MRTYISLASKNSLLKGTLKVTVMLAEFNLENLRHLQRLFKQFNKLLLNFK